MMERLTLEELNNFVITGLRGNGKTIISRALTELKEYKSIEKELGCPLDIIFDALYRGIVCTPHPFYTHEIIYPKKEYNIVQLFQFYYLKVDDGVVDIKDYGKTWWLKKDEEE